MWEISVVFIQELFLASAIQSVRFLIYKIERHIFSLLASIGGFCAPYITSLITRNVRIIEYQIIDLIGFFCLV